MKTPEEIVKDYTTYLGGLSVIYEDKVVEMMYDYAKESSAQIRENLSYYIKLADDFQKERDMWRDNFFKQSDVIDTLESDLKAVKKDRDAWQSEYRAARAEVERLKVHRDVKNRALVLEYAKWYEHSSLPEEQVQEDWMIEQNVNSFFDVRL
jgi:septal ring factor EnvC (AmiA/AmiB activator)